MLFHEWLPFDVGSAALPAVHLLLADTYCMYLDTHSSTVCQYLSWILVLCDPLFFFSSLTRHNLQGLLELCWLPRRQPRISWITP